MLKAVCFAEYLCESDQPEGTEAARKSAAVRIRNRAARETVPEGTEAFRSSAAHMPEMHRAVRALREAGFRSGILYFSKGNPLPPDLYAAPEETLFLCGDGALLQQLRGCGWYAVGYAHDGNSGERFPGASYIVQEPDLVDPDSYVKMHAREAGLPWTILRTRRCLVREFTVADLDALYALYDGQARRFLTPLSEDRQREREILGAYIDRIYRLYGFGHWAVLLREGESGECTGPLIGRVGFSALTAQQELEALELGIREKDREDSGIDADFGFLIAASCRGTGIAEEVCAALLEYGFSQLGFTLVRADARTDNAPSLRLLEKLGFTPAGTKSGRRIFLRGRV
ncbi:MAG: GNAT family N-acetyltransferase [Eubacteriales bacterium]|nr:GNAT family N-acetyltransferase [Eubacteriales bacterium]